jgi:hypothetical protein
LWSGTGCWTSGTVAFWAAQEIKNRAGMIGKNRSEKTMTNQAFQLFN